MKNFYTFTNDRSPFDLVQTGKQKWSRLHVFAAGILTLFAQPLLADVHGKKASPSAEFYITSQTPAPGSTGIPLGMTAITITFNENYKTVNGKTVSLKRYDTDGSATTSTFVNQTFATNSFTINFEFTSFLYGKKMYILVEDGAFTDHDNNPFEGISSKDAWTFTIEQDPNYESDPPVITSRYPINTETGVNRTTSISLGFDEYVYMVSDKDVEVRKYSDDALIKTIVTPVSGTYSDQWTLTEQLDVTLDYSTKYYVLMEEGAFKDEWENLTPAISSKDAWTFTTLDPDTQAPQAEGFEVPTDDQTDLGLFPYAFYASFDEDIYLIPETSAVIVLKKQDGSTVETFTSDDLSVEGSSVSINHYLILEPSTSYYFTFGAGLVEDEAGNDFPGFTDVNTWNFTTRLQAQEDLFVSSVLPSAGSTDISLTPTIRVNFNYELTLGHGIVRLKKTSNDAVVKEWDFSTTSEYSISDGTYLTLTGAPTLEYSTGYYLEMENALEGLNPVLFSFEDGYYAGWQDDFWTFTTLAPAFYATSFSPTNGATGVAAGTNLSITFNAAVNVGSGSITVHKVSDNSQVGSISNFNGSYMSIDGSTITFDFASNLPTGQELYVNVSSGYLRSMANGDDTWSGIQDNTTWRFTTLTPDVTAPTISVLSPSDNATGVSISSDLSVTFNESISAGSGTIIIKRLSDNQTVASVSIGGATINGSVLTINPSNDLDYSTEYYLDMSIGLVTDAALNQFAGLNGNPNWTFTTEAAPDTQGPTISSFTPTADATNVDADGNLTITFSENVVAGTGQIQIQHYVSQELIETMAVGSESVTIEGNTVTINPTNTLPYNSRIYVIFLTGTFKDEAGNEYELDEPILSKGWSFTTEAQDLQGPTFTTGSPANGSTGVGINETITINFSESLTIPVNGATKWVILRSTDNTFSEGYVFGGSKATVSGTQVVITNPNLPYGKSIYFTIAEGVLADAAGNWISDINSSSTWSITTEAAPDNTAPIISSFSPTADATNVDADGNLTITFSESVVAGTGNIQIQHYVSQELIETIAVGSGNVAISGNTVTINPTNTLPYNSKIYVIFLTGTFKDVAGNEYELDGVISSKGWSFTTEGAPDETAPTISSFSPTTDATNVDADGNLTITFSENVVAGTGQIQIQHYVSQELIETMAVGSESVTIEGNTVTINPTNTLPYNSRIYVIFLTGTFKDEAGNEYELDEPILSKGWSFTTEAQDLQGPTFTTGSPANGSTGVGINETITLNFSESLTIPGNGATKWVILRSTDNTFSEGYTLGGSNATVSGTQVVITNPNLPYGKSIYFTINEGVLADVAGNWISDINSSTSWSITTEAAPDSQVPTVTTLSPANGAQNVAGTTNLTLTFDEAIQKGETGKSIQVRSTSDDALLQNIPVGNSIVQISGNQAIIDPSTNIPLGSAVYVTIEAGTFKDLAGNAFAGILDKTTWAFTTEGTDQTSPYVSTFLPADGTTGVELNAPIKLTFNKSIQLSASTGMVKIFKQGGTLVQEVTIQSSNIQGHELTIPHADFEFSTTYYVQITSGVILDLAGNAFAGITTTTTWDFTTKADKQTQTITFGSLSDKTYGDQAFSLSAQASSGLTVQFSSSNTNVVSISGTTATIVGAGEVTITASQSGNESFYAATSVGRSFIVNKAGQTITIQPIQNQVITAGPISVSAQVNTGLPLTYSITGPASLSGTTINLSGQTGTVTVTVNQAGTANYQAANESITFSVTDIEKQDQSISFDVGPSKVYGDAPFDLSATSSSGLPVSFSIVSGSASVAGTRLTLTGAGAVVIRATQEGNASINPAESVLRTITVAKAKLTIAAESKTMVAGGTMPSLTMSFTGFVNGDDTRSITAPSISTTATVLSEAGTYPITLSGGSALNYAISLVGGQLTITKATQGISIEAVSSKTYGDEAFELIATATSGLPVTFSAEGPVSLEGNLVTILGAGEVTVTVDQAGNGFFAASEPISISFVIAKAVASITLSDLEQEADGTPKQPTVVTSPEGLEYILSFDGSEQLPSVAGTYQVGITIIDANYEGTALGEFVLTSEALGFESALEVAVYPNPATDYLQVKSGASEVVRIYSLDGLEVRTAATNQLIEVASLPEGVYLLRVKNAVIRIRKN